ncbi:MULTISPECIES: hypothetical protein [Myroides]|uniref:SMI1/KNR4 family protein n=1 Tax=Myroides albus TaxID=2562892 RepID=A0A6I3LN43_9FLAO|nr:MULTISPECIES: hypothetical protein [Myroides]MTG97405.1 hypothetical protein [Myroides albus]MVX35099.1 hypothetical protein [Myroides sp. LoEW2-1]UVD79434.1 hypothetical protein NWE55_15115 [Myroides albus]
MKEIKSINVALFDQAVEIMKQKFNMEKRPLTKTAEANFIRNFGEEIGTFFINHSYESGWRFGKNLFSQVAFLHGSNFSKYNKEIYKKGYYIIGSGLHDDLIILNLNTGTIGYIDSDLFYRSEKEYTVEELFKDTGLDLGTFYYRSVVEDDNFYGRASDL